MGSITSVVTTGQAGATATINGTGFGATQGDSLVLFYPVQGFPVWIPATSWSDTVLVVDIPAAATVGAQGYFMVQVGNSGNRSESFSVLAADTPAETYFAMGSTVNIEPGVMGTPLVQS